MKRLYDFLLSGNCYKPRLLMNQLGISYQRVNVDILKQESRTAAFLDKNPNGRVPVLELEDGRILAESNAILWYLADGTPLLPKDKFLQAQVLRWMFFEQFSHEPYIASSRYWIEKKKKKAEYARALAEKKTPGYHALGVMDDHLATRPFFVGDSYSIADVALYAYTHVAEEGEFDLAGFPHVQVWLERITRQPGYIPITMEP